MIVCFQTNGKLKEIEKEYTNRSNKANETITEMQKTIQSLQQDLKRYVLLIIYAICIKMIKIWDNTFFVCNILGDCEAKFCRSSCLALDVWISVAVFREKEQAAEQLSQKSQRVDEDKRKLKRQHQAAVSVLKCIYPPFASQLSS